MHSRLAGVRLVLKPNSGVHMTNPFDVPDTPYLVLVNVDGQHSLWPVFADVPAGWTVAHGPAARAACLEYVTASWTDMRPRELAEYLDGGGRDRRSGAR
jgi:MbtH protein